MYEKETDQKVEELLSLVRALDTKIKFILDDTEELKQSMAIMNETVVQLAMDSAAVRDRASSEVNKSSRLEAFRQQTARW